MIDTEKWIKKAKNVHGEKYDYSKVSYTRSIDKVIIGCPLHGFFEIEARCHLKYTGCFECGKISNAQKRRVRNNDNKKEYAVWAAIIHRCINAKKEDYTYRYYKAKGITVCDRWIGSKRGEGFLNFLKDMGNRPSDNHSIDRIDGTKGYSPENCRWATSKEQQNNRPEFNHYITYNDIKKTSAEWADLLGLDRHVPAIWNKRGIINKMFNKYKIDTLLYNNKI